MTKYFSPDKKLNHYPELVKALKATALPDRDKAEKIAAGFTLPPNLCFGVDGLQRIGASLSLSEFANDRFADAFGFNSLSDLQTQLDAASIKLSSYAQSEIDKENAQQESKTPARSRSLPEGAPPSQMEAILLPMSRPTKEDGHPLDRYALDSSPIWSVLFCEPIGPQEHIDAYQKLVADVSVLCAKYIADNADTQGYEEYLKNWAKTKIQPRRNPLYVLRSDDDSGTWKSRLLNGFRELRKLSALKYALTLERLHTQHTKPFAQRFEAVMHLEFQLNPDTTLVEDQSPGYQALRNIRLLLEMVRPDLFPQLLGPNPNTSGDRDGSATPSDSAGHVRISDAWFIHLDEEDNDPYFSYISEIAGVDDTKALEVHSESWAPGELLSEPLAYKCEIPRDYQDISPAAKLLLSSRSDSQLKRRNNRSALDFTTLTLDEIEAVQRFLCDIAIPSSTEPNIQKKARAFLHAMLVTGRSTEDVKTLTVTPEPDSSSATLCFHPIRHEWHILLHEPTYQTQQSRTEIHNQRPLTNRLVLPDESSFARRLPPFDGAPYKLINRHTDAVKKEIDNLAKCLSPTRSMPESRIRAPLWQELMRVSNYDYALGFFITENPVAHARTTVYYATYSLDYVQARYRHAMKALTTDRFREELGEAKRLSKKETVRIYESATDDNPAKFIGARYCPTDTAIKDLINSIKAQLTRKPGKSAEQLMHYHNAYTLYSFVVVALGTALRGVSDPAPDFVSAESGWLGLSEKCRVDLDRRIVPATDITIAQLNNLQNHNVQAAKLFRKAGPALRKHLYSVSVSDTKLEFTPLSERTWKILTRNFGLPMNSFRHYVRTRLIELKTDPAYVDALLGHWARGCAPFDEFSCISPVKFQHEMREAINKLYAELNIAARRSHFSK